MLRLLNRSDRYLTVLATFENRTLGEEKRMPLDLDPNRPLEIGWSDGWVFRSHERVTLRHDAYRAITFQVP
ncbi:MAG: hypothetical protein IPM29_06125 [Planctomycetes bacterium]|nr:hypothetical protein [Planctomycetota bacterium]